MRTILLGALVVCVSIAGGYARPQGSSFVGHWDFNLAPGFHRASWLGISEKGGALDVWYQPTGGNVRQLKQDEVKIEGGKLILTVEEANPNRNRPADTWELEAHGDKLTGVMKHGSESTPIVGVRAPKLDRPAPKAWTASEPLFNGKNLDGWEPIGNPANSHWVVQNGDLVNTAHGDNLRTTRSFTDFKVHFEVNCPDDANSGFYLRGRYEVQLEYEPLANNPPERRMGSIYGRITPKELPRHPGTWETFDVTLVGRTVSVVRDGVTVIDHKVIDGITGGALDANEGEPGPFYIQGDHTGGLRFRNITVSVPKS